MTLLRRAWRAMQPLWWSAVYLPSFIWQNGHDLYWWRWSARRSIRRVALRDFEPATLPRAFPWAALSDWRIGFAGVVVGALAASWVGARAMPELQIGRPLPALQAWLGALWQVEAAVVGFSLAVAIYAYEMLGRRAGIAKDLALAASFPAAVNLGLAMLALTGVTVLRPLDPSHHRWLDGTVLVLALGWLGALVVATREAIELNDPRYRVRMRQRVLLPLVEEGRRARHAAVGSMQVLEDAVARAGGTYETLGVRVSGLEESAIVRSGKRGVLADINWGRLGWAISEAARRGAGPTVGLRIEQRLNSDTPIAFVSGSVPPSMTMTIRRSQRVISSRSNAAAQVELLLLEAQATIGTDPLVLEAVLQAFEDSIGLDVGAPSIAV
jgi:hypothetical protein